MDPAEALDRLLRAERLALATDFDGTVSEIAPSPELAVIDPRCRELLAGLAGRLPLVAIVSGRPLADARQLVGLSELVCVGSHGLEWWENGAVHRELFASSHVESIHSVFTTARDRLKAPGLVFEEKPTGAAIHYRLTSDPAAARREIASVLRELTAGTELKVLEGRLVVELRPAVAVDKGTALLDLLLRYGVTGAIYAGDDTTDLDAFAGIRRWAFQTGGEAVTVAVTSAEMPSELSDHADLVVEGVEGWADLMETLLTGLDTLAPG